jgi:hypothetical protein
MSVPSLMLSLLQVAACLLLAATEAEADVRQGGRLIETYRGLNIPKPKPDPVWTLSRGSGRVGRALSAVGALPSRAWSS